MYDQHNEPEQDEMDFYIGTKIIKACSCMNDGKPGFKVVYEDGYESWSPEKAFAVYQHIGGPLDFSHALLACKQGCKIQRRGWNGKDMYIVYQKAYPEGIPINKNTAEATGIPEGTICRFLPYLMMKTADGAFVPWLISQTDALAEDWTVI